METQIHYIILLKKEIRAKKYMREWVSCIIFLSEIHIRAYA